MKDSKRVLNHHHMLGINYFLSSTYFTVTEITVTGSNQTLVSFISRGGYELCQITVVSQLLYFTTRRRFGLLELS